MKKVTLSFPANLFTKDFLDTEVKKELGVRGDMLPWHLKKKPVHKPTTGIFDHKMIYCCKLVNGNVLLVGASR